MSELTIRTPDDIKPCPLCGGCVASASLSIEFEGEEVMYVECAECGTEFTIHGIRHRRIEITNPKETIVRFVPEGVSAINKWNRRANDKRAD